MPTNSVSFKMNFKNSDYTKTITFDDVSDSALASVKQKIIAINTALNNGSPSTTAGNTLSYAFIDPDVMDPDNPSAGGNLASLSDAKVITVTKTKIPLF